MNTIGDLSRCLSPNRITMATKTKFDPRKLMEKAIAEMKRSINEPRADKKASPMVGAVLWKPDGSVETDHRGELREGDHAEFTLLERKNRATSWMTESGFDERKAQRVLRKLMEEGLVRRVGKGRATQYMAANP